MERCRLLSVAVSLFSILLTINANLVLGAYEIGYKSIIQFKVHENGDKNYKLALFITDEVGFVSEDVVTNVKLTDPDGKVVPLSSLEFSTVSTYTRGEFFADDAGWTYPASPLDTYGDWSADILTPLVTGEYTVEVATDDGEKHIINADFEHFEIPVISSCTFQLNQDADGNV